jgi:hypothetical protein
MNRQVLRQVPMTVILMLAIMTMVDILKVSAMQ